MDVQLIERLNDLWRPIYPYLAQWIAQLCPVKKGWILELGPFSGGICDAMGNRYPDVRTVCLIHQKELVPRVKKQFGKKLEYTTGPLDVFPFKEPLKVIVSRGAFFFLTPDIIKECFKALATGSSALLGGGYGPLTPEKEIKQIAEESKDLNDRLGKKWVSKGELKGMVAAAGLESFSHIIDEGGLWLLLQKH